MHRTPSRLGGLGLGCLLLLAAPPARAQFTGFLVGAGTGIMDQEWAYQDERPGTTTYYDQGVTGSCLTLSLSAGCTGTLSPRAGWRALLKYTSGANEFTAIQAGADLRWTWLKWWDREVYTVAGPTLNFVRGTYTLREGYIPPYGHGEYRELRQEFRPGLKLGAGFQFARRWSVELSANLVSMETGGAQGIDRSTTNLIDLAMFFRPGRLETQGR